MKHLLYSIFILLFTFGNSQAQRDTSDLWNTIQNAEHDTTKIHAYLDFFLTDLFYDAPEKVIDYLHKAKNLSKKINYPQGEVDAMNNLGYTYRTQSVLDSAIYYYSQSTVKAKKSNYYKGLTDAYIGLGNVYNQQSLWPKAIEQFHTVIKIARTEGDSIQIGSAFNNIGNAYLSQSKYENALTSYQKAAELGDDNIREVALINIAVVHNQMENIDQARSYFEQSISVAEKLDKKGHLAFIHRNLGILEKKAENFEKSLSYYKKALEHYESISDDYSSSEIIQNMGNVYYQMKNFAFATEFYERSLEIQKEIGYASGACYNLYFLARVYHDQNQFNLSKDYLRQVEICSDSLDLLPTKSDAAFLMSDILSKEGRYQEALRYFKIHKNLSDSLTNLGSDEKIAELDTKYQTAQKEQEIKLLSAQNEVAALEINRQRTHRNFLIILAFGLILIAFALYSRYIVKEKANLKLKELDALKNKFYAEISHEFRTPLTLMLNPLDKILNSSEDLETIKNAKLAEMNASRLLELTNQILDLSKIEARKMNLLVGPYPIESFLKIIADSFDSLAKSKNIVFSTSFQKDQDTIYFDRDKLQKILNNLLSNAFKFTPSGGKIELNANLKNKWLYVEVKDSGPGLKDEEKKKIFERFHQNGIGSFPEGTGLGLTLTKELVELHKGAINLDSEKGVGSCFSLKIPVDKNSFQNNEFIQSTIEHTLESQENIVLGPNEIQDNENQSYVLIVEDNDELRSFLGELFQGDYRILYAKNGKEGLSMAIETIPDIIISDWMMPEMDGVELCGYLKKDERTSHIPVILLTARADQSSKIDGLKIGADDYVSKPFNNEELLIRVQNLIEQRQLLRSKFSETQLFSPSKIEIADPDKQFLERVIQILEKHLDNAEFTVEKFQKEMAMSRMQLHRKLKAIVDQSASEFIRNFRLQRAATLLAKGNFQVSEVAYQCGFNNLSYFGHCFKEKFGVSPSQYQ